MAFGSTGGAAVNAKGQRKIQVGAVSYLNTKPLVYRFDQYAPNAELTFDLPSRLADRLATDDLDIALIPSVEVFQNPGYTVVSDACIACRGPVMSVKLLSSVALEQITTLALDEGSRTSVALARVLLYHQFQVTPHLDSLPIGGRPEEADVDAVLLIGDRAIHAECHPFVRQWDLGEQWYRWTGLPFVFAMWTAREGIDGCCIDSALRQSRDAGLENLPNIARESAQEVGLDSRACLTYLRDNLHFQLGPLERRGLQLFYDYALELGIVPNARTLTSIGLTSP